MRQQKLKAYSRQVSLCSLSLAWAFVESKPPTLSYQQSEELLLGLEAVLLTIQQNNPGSHVQTRISFCMDNETNYNSEAFKTKRWKLKQFSTKTKHISQIKTANMSN